LDLGEALSAEAELMPAEGGGKHPPEAKSFGRSSAGDMKRREMPPPHVTTRTNRRGQMNRGQMTLILLLAAICGFAGGVLSSRLPLPSQALAQQGEKGQDVVTARLVCGEEFRLLNRQGALRAKFEVTQGDAVVVAFYHKDGKRRTVYEFSPEGVPRLSF